MADRADYLARTLLSRLATLSGQFAEDGRGAPDRRARIATVEKVLAVELGVTDSATLSIVEAAAPSGSGGAQGHGRELAAFADFLRQRLAGHLAER